MDPFSFVTSESLDYPLSVRIINLEGEEALPKASELLRRPDLRYIGSNTRYTNPVWMCSAMFKGTAIANPSSQTIAHTPIYM